MPESRLLRLLTVLQTRRFWSGAELAERLEITPRTLRRDVDRLRTLGYSVEATSGPGGGYQLGCGADLPPLTLNEDEAIAVAVSLQNALTTFSDLNDTVLAVLVKLDQLLPRRVQEQVKAVPLATFALESSAPRLDARVLALLASACRDTRSVRFLYRGRVGEETDRDVEPLKLVQTGNRRWYLVCWDRGRLDFRLFRLDRIVDGPTVGNRFTPKELPEDVRDYVSRSLSSESYEVRARVRVRAAADVVERAMPPWVGRVEKETDTTALLTLGTHDLRSLAAHLLHVDADFELLEPLEARPVFGALAARLEASVREPS